MEGNGYIKPESATEYQDGAYDEFFTNSIEDNNHYFEYVNEPNESLIEYDEEEDNETEKIKTHTLTFKSYQIDGKTRDILRCIECGTDFATIDDFTKVHQDLQKSQPKNKTENATKSHSIEADLSENSNNELEQEEQGWMTIKEEFIKEENVANVHEDIVNDLIYVDEDESAVLEAEEVEFLSQDITSVGQDNVAVMVDDGSNDDMMEGEKYFCCDCQLVFGDLKSAEQHLCSASNNDTNEINEKSLKENAAEQFEPDNKLQNSIERQQKKPQYQCGECNIIFNTYQGFHIHSRSHKSKKQVKSKTNVQQVVAEAADSPTCPICNTAFSSSKNLKLHMKIHNEQQLRTIEQALPAGAKAQYTDMNKFFCEICNKSFEQNLLGIHKQMHLQSAGYNCGTCNRHFDNKTSYEMHIKMHADRPQKPRKSQRKPAADGSEKKDGRFPCQYCGRTFQRPFEKVRHERVHTGEKPHACEVCGKTFRVPYSLTLHLRTHTDIRPYVCATCNKRFKSQTVYSHHLRTHESERSYKCETCSKTFRTSVQLSAHRNIHSKPYSCPICSRPFASLYYVKMHMKTHNKTNRTGDNTKYTCYICGAVYARISALRLHMKELHLIDMDTNEPLDLNDDYMLKVSANVLNQKRIQEEDDDLGAEDEDDKEKQRFDDEEDEVDHEAAVLIAAAADADCAAYMEAESADANTTEARTSNIKLDSTHINPTEFEVILTSDELIVDNYQTEEVVTNWLTK